MSCKAATPIGEPCTKPQRPPSLMLDHTHRGRMPQASHGKELGLLVGSSRTNMRDHRSNRDCGRDKAAPKAFSNDPGRESAYSSMRMLQGSNAAVQRNALATRLVGNAPLSIAILARAAQTRDNALDDSRTAAVGTTTTQHLSRRPQRAGTWSQEPFAEQPQCSHNAASHRQILRLDEPANCIAAGNWIESFGDGGQQE
ncbi:hypothetical protein EJ03DRAFT_106992 [Teratosphaeria nubilosa]|uniref:Uncharacterized protein n=1 Tax=Teratosphaeria nubilosa TaxID=161662 RepID=A0A6G1L8B0_9PEZI|nr:hypothetical protein EJ03DRAFT_106992 [Teratosphaeria nubilosa]